jgi:hypothetical protein
LLGINSFVPGERKHEQADLASPVPMQIADRPQMGRKSREPFDH